MNKYKELFPVQSSGILNDANIPCFKNGIFDIIVFVNYLMFIDDKVKLIEHYKKFLTTNGKIIIMDILDGNLFYRIWKKFNLEYDKVSTKNITYNEIEEICQKSAIFKKNYFYCLSILTTPFLLRFPENMIIRKIHCVVDKIDRYIL
jgi:SAM-dependent methyltransferase